MCDVSASLVLAHGAGSGLSHVARQLEAADIRESTIILTASRRHRAAVVAIRPSAQVRTFTINQAARIIGWRGVQGARPPAADLPNRLLWLGEELDTYRTMAPQPEIGALDDLRDPHGRARHSDIFPRLVAAVDSLCAPLLRPG
jgi:protein-tyrosine phosphatase